jgi:hypothetical protein
LKNKIIQNHIKKIEKRMKQTPYSCFFFCRERRRREEDGDLLWELLRAELKEVMIGRRKQEKINK